MAGNENQRQWSGGSPQSAFMMLADQGYAIIDGREFIMENGRPREFTPEMQKRYQEYSTGIREQAPPVDMNYPSAGRVPQRRGVFRPAEDPYLMTDQGGLSGMGGPTLAERESGYGSQDARMGQMYSDALERDHWDRFTDRANKFQHDVVRRQDPEGYRNQTGASLANYRGTWEGHHGLNPNMPAPALTPGGSAYEEWRRHQSGGR
tara:strand:- start:4702 stop:5319 length:618 start_codon:yes stop_codon:yes gene_type:complete